MSMDASLPVDSALLPRDPDLLLALVAQLMEELRKRDQRVAELEHRMDLLLKRLYGSSSEKLDPAQLSLFDATPEEPVPQPPPTPSRAPSAAPAAKAGHGRRRLPDRLKRIEVIHDLTVAEKDALGGEAKLVLIGREETEQLEWEPSSLYVIHHVQLTYARREQLPQSGDALADKNVVTAGKPPQPIPGGLPGPGLMAHVAVSKYVDHLPLHRQERQFTRHGLFLPRQTTCDWAMAGAELALPIYELAKQEVLLSGVLHNDATSVKIRDAREKLKRTGYFWPYVGDAAHPLIVFDYTPTQSRDGPAAFLKDYRGFLQVDAHSVYDGLFSDGRMVEVGCWMHARRRFFEARTLDRMRAETALLHIGRLYALEREIAEQIAHAWCELSLEERHARIAALRRERAAPVLKEFFLGWRQRRRSCRPSTRFARPWTMRFGSDQPYRGTATMAVWRLITGRRSAPFGASRWAAGTGYSAAAKEAPAPLVCTSAWLPAAGATRSIPSSICDTSSRSYRFSRRRATAAPRPNSSGPSCLIAGVPNLQPLGRGQRPTGATGRLPCVSSAQAERVIVTRDGHPVALIVGIKGLDAEQVELGSSDTFWQLISERRNETVISRMELERKLNPANPPQTR